MLTFAPLNILSQLIYYIMRTGTVKFFNNAKGFGFVKDNETNEEYFVHVTGLKTPIKENDTVTFEVREGKRGMVAADVSVQN